MDAGDRAFGLRDLGWVLGSRGCAVGAGRGVRAASDNQSQWQHCYDTGSVHGGTSRRVVALFRASRLRGSSTRGRAILGVRTRGGGFRSSLQRGRRPANRPTCCCRQRGESENDRPCPASSWPDGVQPSTTKHDVLVLHEGTSGRWWASVERSIWRQTRCARVRGGQPPQLKRLCSRLAKLGSTAVRPPLSIRPHARYASARRGEVLMRRRIRSVPALGDDASRWVHRPVSRWSPTEDGAPSNSRIRRLRSGTADRSGPVL